MIAYFVDLEPEEQTLFAGAFPDDDLRFVGSLSDVCADAEVLCVFFDSVISREFVEAHGNLRLVATRSSGVDHIDVEACREKGVAVSYVPVYGETTVAEHTFALILALARRLREAMELPQRGKFSYHAARGFDLAGKTLGVIGLGRIGQRVAAFGHCFGMRVLGYDPIEMSEDFATEHRLEWRTLEDLLQESHVVSLHVKLSDMTRHMLNRETLGLCRRGVIIINTARGGLIDTLALQEALDSGQVGGVGLDVLEDERVMRKPVTDIISAEIVEHLKSDAHPAESHHPGRLKNLQSMVAGNALLRRSNVVFTPHVAFNTVDAIEKMHEVTLENLRAYKNGSPKNLV